MAAEYGVIGEISRGSSTAANARKRRLSSRYPSFSLSLSFYLSHDPFSVTRGYSVSRIPRLSFSSPLPLFSPRPLLSFSLSFFLAALSVLWPYVNALMGVFHELLWIASTSKRVVSA